MSSSSSSSDVLLDIEFIRNEIIAQVKLNTFAKGGSFLADMERLLDSRIKFICINESRYEVNSFKNGLYRHEGGSEEPVINRASVARYLRSPGGFIFRFHATSSVEIVCEVLHDSGHASNLILVDGLEYYEPARFVLKRIKEEEKPSQQCAVNERSIPDLMQCPAIFNQSTEDGEINKFMNGLEPELSQVAHSLSQRLAGIPAKELCERFEIVQDATVHLTEAKSNHAEQALPTYFLYHISRPENCGYDEYSDAIVVATSEAEARSIHPGYGYTFLLNTSTWDGERTSTWIEASSVIVEQIGVFTGVYSKDKQVVCASFHAG